MNKISGILPSNNRISTVDREGEQRLRSGHGATFGQKVSKSEVVRTAKPKLTLHDAPRAFDRVSERKQKDKMHAAMVERMSNDFFARKVEKPVIPEIQSMPGQAGSTRSSIVERNTPAKVERSSYADEFVKVEDYGAFTVAVDQALDAEMQENDFYTVGENLSIVA